MQSWPTRSPITITDAWDPVVRAFADNSGATIDWLEDHGTAWASIAALGDSYQVWHLPADESGMPTHVGDVLSVIQPAAEELGVQFRISTPFTGLRVEDGCVTGVYAEGSDGEILIESRAVIPGKRRLREQSGDVREVHRSPLCKR